MLDCWGIKLRCHWEGRRSQFLIPMRVKNVEVPQVPKPRKSEIVNRKSN